MLHNVFSKSEGLNWGKKLYAGSWRRNMLNVNMSDSLNPGRCMVPASGHQASTPWKAELCWESQSMKYVHMEPVFFQFRGGA